MSDFIGVDASELTQLAIDFGNASAKAVDEIDEVVEHGALKVKNHMAADARSSGYYKHFHRSISYDRVTSINQVSYEIGPDKSRRGAQGALGNILYFGTSKNGPVLDIEAPLKAEEPHLVKHLADVAERLAAEGR